MYVNGQTYYHWESREMLTYVLWGLYYIITRKNTFALLIFLGIFTTSVVDLPIMFGSCLSGLYFRAIFLY